MRKHVGSLVTVGENGHDEDEIAFDSYEISSVSGEKGLIKIVFVNGISLAEEDDEVDVPVQEIIIGRDAFVSFAVTTIPTVTIPKAEYDSLKETVDILGDAKTVEDIRQSVIEMVTEIVAKQKAGDADGEFVPASELARLREIAESITLKEAALIQDLAAEAEAGYDLNKPISRAFFGTDNLMPRHDG